MPKVENSLTEKVERILKEEILRGVWKPGENFPSENESAKRFQISRVTVRRAYANLEKMGIIVRRMRCQTKVNKRLSAATEPITMVGALFPLRNDFTHEFLMSLNTSMTPENALIVLPPIFADGAGQDQAARTMVSHGIRNFIVWGCDNSIDMEMYRRFRLLGINFVFFDHIRPGDIADFVSIDTKHAIETLFQKALADGCREFAFLNTAGSRSDSNEERQLLLEALCRKHGCPCRVENLSWEDILRNDAPEACRAFFETIRDPKKTGIFCANARLAYAVSQAEGGKGKYYSISTAELPLGDNIVTIRQPMDEMARACFDLLLEQQKTGNKWQPKCHTIKGREVWKQPGEKRDAHFSKGCPKTQISSTDVS